MSAAAEARPVVLLDGGMGQELVTRSRHPVHPLWGAMVMLQEPEIVREVHLDYIAAGARVITINAYSLSPERLARAGMAESFDELQGAACRLAREAREAAGAAGEDVAIAGCLPPLVGSYRAGDVPADPELARSYARIAEAQAPHVDLFVCETMSLAREAAAAARAALATGKPVWVAWTLEDDRSGRLRSGETVAEAFAAVEPTGVSAVLANCCHPESIDAAAGALAATGRPWGGYANGFVSVDALAPGGTVEVLQSRRDLGPGEYAGYALGWVERGAAIVGGCCEIGPGHIARLAEGLLAAGHTIRGHL